MKPKKVNVVFYSENLVPMYFFSLTCQKRGAKKTFYNVNNKYLKQTCAYGTRHKRDHIGNEC